MSIEKMKPQTSSDCLLNDDNNEDVYLSWEEMKFRFIGTTMTEFSVPKEEMCQDVKDVTNVFLPTIYQTMEECAQTCPKFQKSFIPMMATKEQYKSLQPKYQRWADGLGPAFWFRVRYSDSSMGFMDWYTGDIIDMSDIRGSNEGFRINL